MLFHITTQAAWDEAQTRGVYVAPSLQTEGFIHLSSEHQWPRTLERFFRGQAGLVLLFIDETQLEAEVCWEAADGESFPHLYGALNLSAVVQTATLP